MRIARIGISFARELRLKAFKFRLEQALASGAALAVLSIPACSGTVSNGTSSAAGAASTGSTSASAGAPSGNNLSTGGVSGAGTSGTDSSAGQSAAPGTESGGQPGSLSAGAAGAAGQTEPGPAGTGGVSQQELEPYPLGSLGCSGPSYGGGLGFHGQCCTAVSCYTPPNGSDCVLAKDAPLPLGKCLCGAGVQGPFAANPADQPVKTGTCCYVISSIGCDGRPLLVDGAPIVSPLTRRSDWISRELLDLVA